MIPSVVKSMATLHMPADIMDEFASNTGLATNLSAPRRYLWTDAFAVCNFLELHKQSGEQKYLDIALKLVNQVDCRFVLHKNGSWSSLEKKRD